MHMSPFLVVSNVFGRRSVSLWHKWSGLRRWGDPAEAGGRLCGAAGPRPLEAHREGAGRAQRARRARPRHQHQGVLPSPKPRLKVLK